MDYVNTQRGHGHGHGGEAEYEGGGGGGGGGGKGSVMSVRPFCESSSFKLKYKIYLTVKETHIFFKLVATLVNHSLYDTYVVMKIFDKTKSFSPDHFFFFFDITNKNYFVGGKIVKNSENGAASCKIYDSNPICVSYCSIM